ncbi:glycosyltransferase family 4 protein [Actinoplanes sp. NPDC049265]|uniref:glycosyltransferase family 4 protein n=1 Tax=Actinoplanes sp. NPDC049265 TaxID=3363902 RepID=UPI00372171E0
MTVTMDEPLGGISDPPEATRGRVVMLVDNGVDGDSRVQKAARSAAAAGWEVTLLGVAHPNARRVSWRLGQAEVKLVRTRRPLFTHHSKLRWSPRRPLAYSSTALAANRRQTVAGRYNDVHFRIAELAAARRAGAGRGAELAGLLRLLPGRALLKIQSRWVRLRTGELRRLTEARGNPHAPLTWAGNGIWRILRGRRSWRRLDPSLWDFELSMSAVIDGLEPDIIHAHDYKMLGVGARAKVRAAARGRTVKLVWDAHEYVPGLAPFPGWPGWLPAQVGYEREYAPHADAVVTVSPALAELLRAEHRLRELPAVVMNCPTMIPVQSAVDDEPPRELRADCEIDRATPLIAYGGGLSVARNTILLVEALTELPGVHLALVCVPPSERRAAADEHLARARELGVADRVHVLPYVPHDQVVSYLSAADVAVSPLLHLPNHEIALSNKFFEYAQARLPIVVSDTRTMAATVTETGQGEVYPAGDLDGYLRAVRAVLSDPDRYRSAYDRPGRLDEWTWERQAAVLDTVYDSVLPVAPAPPRARMPIGTQLRPGSAS